MEMIMITWQIFGQYECEYYEDRRTGWYRCVGGRLADGRWPEWNEDTGQKRYG